VDADLPARDVVFAIYWSAAWAAGLGALWLIGRLYISSGIFPARETVSGIFHSINCGLRPTAVAP
jgi:hypothetical protein